MLVWLRANTAELDYSCRGEGHLIILIRVAFLFEEVERAKAVTWRPFTVPRCWGSVLVGERNHAPHAGLWEAYSADD